MSVATKKVKEDVTIPESIRLRPDRERVRNATIRAAEQIISPAPSWLSDVLADQSFKLISAHSIEEIWPTRQQLREELREIYNLADLLDRRLQNSAATGFIAVNSSADFHEFSSVARHLDQLRSRIRQALQSPQLVGKNGKLLKGRGKPLLPNTMPPRYICAAIIAEVIDFLYPEKDSRPPQRKAWSAADKLWGTWFEPDPKWPVERTRWKDYFKAVDDPRLLPLRSEMRRVLGIQAQFARLLEEK
jgi:hypothetical protein